jgi:DNA-binding protein H-NS
MKENGFKSLSVEELWGFREAIATALDAKMVAKKSVLEDRLKQLGHQARIDQIGKARRSYAAVSPKYRNPNQPSKTWSGRGKRPRWLAAALKSGKRLDDFRI